MARASVVDGVPALRADRLYAIERALEEAGVVFLAAGEVRQGGPGVRLRQ